MERLYRRRVPADMVMTPELGNELARISHEMGREIGVLINRAGLVEYVMAGSAAGITIPPLDRRRGHPGRLQGLRLVHTHLRQEGLSFEDLTDLAELRLDMIYALTVDELGHPRLAHGAHLLPQGASRDLWQVLEPVSIHALILPFDAFIRELEDTLSKHLAHKAPDLTEDRAILVVVTPAQDDTTLIALDELKELARSAGIVVLETVIQRRPSPDPKFVVGKGKVSQIYIQALALDANLLVFDHELSPSQARSIASVVDMRVIDRTQLILDIFARRARTKEGKIQVELAQLRYNMPRLVGRNPSLSRLAGGIGTRGPGESKLEIDRRRAKERITRLEQEIRRISRKREITRQKRSRDGVPVISIVGYTNSGKSTLLNTLTNSAVATADMPFATLDPSSKRLRFPQEIDVVITDTVGFIRDLPEDLKAAFMATLEELSEASLLLEVIDLSDPHIDYRMQAVDEILKGLGLTTRRLRVFNKADKCGLEVARTMAERYDGIAVSALDRATLPPLIEKMQTFFF